MCAATTVISCWLRSPPASSRASLRIIDARTCGLASTASADDRPANGGPVLIRGSSTRWSGQQALQCSRFDHFRERYYRLRWGRRTLQFLLPYTHVPPLSKLVTALAPNAGSGETHRFMHRHADRAGQGDHADGLGHALQPHYAQQRAVESARDAAAVCVVAHVDRGLGDPVVGGAFAETPGVGIGQHVA